MYALGLLSQNDRDRFAEHIPNVKAILRPNKLVIDEFTRYSVSVL